MATDALYASDFGDAVSLSEILDKIDAEKPTGACLLKTLCIDRNVNLIKDTTVGNHVLLAFSRSGVFTLGDYQLVLRCPIRAGSWRIFDCNGKGTVRFENYNYDQHGNISPCTGLPDKVYPQWWGVYFSAGVDSSYYADKTSAAIQSALDSIADPGGVVFLPSGHYRINQTLVLPQKVSLIGECHQSTIIYQTANSDGIRVKDDKGWSNHLENFTLLNTLAEKVQVPAPSPATEQQQGKIAKQEVFSIKNDKAAIALPAGGLRIRSVSVSQFKYGLSVVNTGYPQMVGMLYVENLAVSYCTYGVYIQGGTVDTTFNNSQILGCVEGIHVDEPANVSNPPTMVNMTNTIIEMVKDYGIYIGRAQSVRVDGCYFEGIGHYYGYFGSGTAIYIPDNPNSPDKSCLYGGNKTYGGGSGVDIGINHFWTCKKQIEVGKNVSHLVSVRGRGRQASGPPMNTEGLRWFVGDTINNSKPQAGQPMGWICIAEGSPGTWRPFGQIG
jgi:hypothetical protein